MFNQLEAIKYLVDNSEYTNEWTGTGMWHAVMEVMSFEGNTSKEKLDDLLKEAANN